MELVFLGIGSAYNTAWFNSSAFFFHEGSLVLLDCGESVFAALMKRKILSNCNHHLFVLLSHLHADHAGSLPSLCSYCAGHLGKKVRVVYPGAEVESFLSLSGIPPQDYEHLSALGDALPGVSAQAIPTHHIPGYPSYGWLIHRGGESCYFSGDSCDIPAEVLDALLACRLSCVYQDVEWNSSEKSDGCHMQYQRLLRLIPPDKRRFVCCMHLNCDYRAIAQADGFRVAPLPMPEAVHNE